MRAMQCTPLMGTLGSWLLRRSASLSVPCAERSWSSHARQQRPLWCGHSGFCFPCPILQFTSVCLALSYNCLSKSWARFMWLLHKFCRISQQCEAVCWKRRCALLVRRDIRKFNIDYTWNNLSRVLGGAAYDVHKYLIASKDDLLELMQHMGRKLDMYVDAGLSCIELIANGAA